MIIKKYLYIVCVLINVPAHAYIDSVRKLVHPRTDHTVFLYCVAPDDPALVTHAVKAETEFILDQLKQDIQDARSTRKFYYQRQRRQDFVRPLADSLAQNTSLLTDLAAFHVENQALPADILVNIHKYHPVSLDAAYQCLHMRKRLAHLANQQHLHATALELKPKLARLSQKCTLDELPQLTQLIDQIQPYFD